jgi:TBC1 domain family member 5
VLFVWAKMHPDISYRQGMHELLGLVFMVCSSDYKDAAALKHYSSLGMLVSIEFLEADVFSLFFALMRHLKHWYEPLVKESPIVVSCKRILNDYLASIDQELYSRFVELDIEPQLFGLYLIV